MPVWVDTGTVLVDKNNLVAFREAFAARAKAVSAATILPNMKGS